jgi:hypothetical protein
LTLHIDGFFHVQISRYQTEIPLLEANQTTTENHLSFRHIDCRVCKELCRYFESKVD